jgi:phage terminase large subunit-like protein
MYAFVTGPDGRLLYPEQVYACPKKSGKTTFAAIYVIIMVLLYGGAYAEAICAANDYEQSVGRVFAAIRRIIECSPLLRDEAKIMTDKIIISGAVIIAIPQLRQRSRQQSRGLGFRRTLGLCQRTLTSAV